MNILALTYWSYKDALVQTCTLPYLRIITKQSGRKVFLVTLEAPDYKLSEEEYKNARTELQKDGIKLITLKYHPFGIVAILSWFVYLFKLMYVISRNKISYIYCWATPAGALGYMLSVLTGRKLVIDCLEPHAEAMVENGTWMKNSFRFKALFSLERKLVKRASHLLFNADGMEGYIKEKYNVEVKDSYVKPNCVDLGLFSFNSVKDVQLLKQYGLEDKVTCVYAGKFGGIYLEDETFAFIKKCEEHWGANKFRFLLLSNASDEYMAKKVKAFGINATTIIKLFVAHRQVPKYMGMADFAICPVKPVPTKRYCSPIKDGEYWALGLPVVIPPNISEDSQIISENKAGAILESFNEMGYINAIKQIDSIISNKSRAEVYKAIRPIAEKYRNFSIAEKIYSEVYPSVV